MFFAARISFSPWREAPQLLIVQADLSGNGAPAKYACITGLHSGSWVVQVFVGHVRIPFLSASEGFV